MYFPPSRRIVYSMDVLRLLQHLTATAIYDSCLEHPMPIMLLQAVHGITTVRRYFTCTWLLPSHFDYSSELQKLKITPAETREYSSVTMLTYFCWFKEHAIGRWSCTSGARSAFCALNVSARARVAVIVASDTRTSMGARSVLTENKCITIFVYVWESRCCSLFYLFRALVETLRVSWRRPWPTNARHCWSSKSAGSRVGQSAKIHSSWSRTQKGRSNWNSPHCYESVAERNYHCTQASTRPNSYSGPGHFLFIVKKKTNVLYDKILCAYGRRLCNSYSKAIFAWVPSNSFRLFFVADVDS